MTVDVLTDVHPNVVQCVRIVVGTVEKDEVPDVEAAEIGHLCAGVRLDDFAWRILVHLEGTARHCCAVARPH